MFAWIKRQLRNMKRLDAADRKGWGLAAKAWLTKDPEEARRCIRRANAYHRICRER